MKKKFRKVVRKVWGFLLNPKRVTVKVNVVNVAFIIIGVFATVGFAEYQISQQETIVAAPCNLAKSARLIGEPIELEKIEIKNSKPIKKEVVKKTKKKKVEKKKEESIEASVDAKYTVYDAPTKETFKSYMPYKLQSGKSIFGSWSDQYRLQTQQAFTDYTRGVRTVNGRYCIAMGSFYTDTIGQYIDIVMDNGSVLECIVGDQKADKDTDPSHRFHAIDGSIVEFIIDSDAMISMARKMGDMSYAGESFEGSIDKIIVYDYVYEF